MKLIFAKSATVSWAIAAAIALPATVHAQAAGHSEIFLASDASLDTSGGQIGTTTNYQVGCRRGGGRVCCRVTGYGIICW
ncbi:MAG: hypothetical protein WBB01_17205 [Phormidesmis sp.]